MAGGFSVEVFSDRDGMGASQRQVSFWLRRVCCGVETWVVHLCGRPGGQEGPGAGAGGYPSLKGFVTQGIDEVDYHQLYSQIISFHIIVMSAIRE